MQQGRGECFVRTLQIQGTFANDALQRFASRQEEKLGGTVMNADPAIGNALRAAGFRT